MTIIKLLALINGIHIKPEKYSKHKRKTILKLLDLEHNENKNNLVFSKTQRERERERERETISVPKIF